jgi:hypothetical protein
MTKTFIISITAVLLYCTGLYSSIMWLSDKKDTEPKVKVILPNDWKNITKYEGDPSLLSAYMRNDSIFLNFEGY